MPLSTLHRRPFAALLSAAVALALISPAAFGQAAPSPTAPVTISSGWVLQDIAKVSDTGDKISQAAYVPNAWNKATVPGTVLTSLVNDGIYPEPLYGENNRPDKIPESLSRTSYWYRTSATVPASYAGKHIWLNFDGINYVADVWVNGQQVGTIRGAWARGMFDVSKFVKPGDTATIAVKINPPPHPGNPDEQTVANGTGRMNGGDLMQDGPTFGCTVGWDWIPAIRDRDMGIWQKVTFSATGDVRVESPSVSSDLPLPRTDSADLTLITTVHNASDQPVEGTLKGSYAGGNFQVPVSLKANETREVTVTKDQAAQLHMNNPKLWWPNTYGDPTLYPMHVAFDVKGAESDARDVNFGVRKITYEVPASETRIPNLGNLTVFVNGVPVMCKGGCWGMDEALKRIPADVIDAKVRFHQLANANMIRNWVGQSTGEDFYNACDKYGIMIWDEMFQANMSDGPQVGGVPRPNDTPETLAWRADVIKMYEENVREKVVRFRSHPSIAIWCGRNESNPAPAEIATYLTTITHDLDPARLFHANSNEGAGVRSGGPYYWRTPVAYFAPANMPAPTPIVPGAAPAAGRAGRGGGRGGGGGIEAFKTELGSVSIPTLEAIKAWMPEKDWYDLNDDWASHDLCRGAQQGNVFPGLMSLRYGNIAARDIADFTRKSQLACYESYRAMYEGRMAKLFVPCSGVLTWMSNPSQPSFVWQYYSYDLEPLAALYGTQKGCEPLHIQYNANDSHLMVINTSPEVKSGLQATVRVYNMDGTQKSEKTMPVSAKDVAATDLGAMTWPDGLTPVHFIKLELRDAQKNLISDNFYWRTTAMLPAGTAAPADAFGAGGRGAPARGGNGRGNAAAAEIEDFSAMQAMPTADLQITLKRHDANGKVLLDAAVSNPTKTPALMAHLQLRNSRTKDRVLPVFYSSNFISLLPGESKMITIEADAKNLGTDQPLLMVDGWNVSVAPKSFTDGGQSAIAPNTDAQVGPKTVTARSTPAPAAPAAQ